MRAPVEKISISQNGQGASIEYTLEPDENISAFINGMLSHNNIKGILGYIYEANGGVRRLRFNHPDGMQLSLLLSHALKKQPFLGILSSIADTVHRAEEYMLDEGGFIFDPELIYVNTTAFDTNLIYIPTGSLSGLSYCQFVKNMLYSSIVSTEEDTSYIQQIANHINSDPFITSDKLGEFIKSLSAGAPRISSIASVAASPQVQPVQVNREPAPARQPVTVPPAPQAEEPKSKKGGLFSGFSDKKKSKKAEKPAKEQPSGGFGFNIPGQSPAAASAKSSGFGFNIPGQSPAASAPAKPMPAPPQTPPAQQPSFQQPVQAPPQNNNIAQLAPESDYNDDDGKTVLLGASSGAPQKGQAYLERRNGERVYITKNNFFIGKADKSDIPNDYIVRNNAVSRNHAYLQLTPNGATITDNNSSNGTFVNGERIPSQVNRELKQGDVVRLANEEFVFGIG